MSKLQKVQGLLNRLAAIRESWNNRKHEVVDVIIECDSLFHGIDYDRSHGGSFNDLFKSLHGFLSDELRFLTTYPAQAPSEERKVPHDYMYMGGEPPADPSIPVGTPEEPLLVPLDEIPDGMKFELGVIDIERCRRFSPFMVECKSTGGIGTIFFNLPSSFLVRPISMPDTESSYEVDPADLILPPKSAEVELINLTFGSKFELGGIELHVVESGFGDTICCHYSNFIGARRELYLPSRIKVTPK